MNPKRHLVLGVILLVAGILMSFITIYQFLNNDRTEAYNIAFEFSFVLLGVINIRAFFRDLKK